jgi:ABC-type nitrate/sulfonate/bicarbonate transport system substrate-binding protein
MLFKKFAVLMMLLFLAACGSTDEETVTLVLDWAPNTNHTGFFVAMERGYFAEEGITLNIIVPPEDGAVPLVATGRYEFGVSFQEETILAANSPTAPLPIVTIATIVEHNTSGIMSLAEHNITRFRDLEGRTFGTWGIPMFDEIVSESVRMDGGDPDLVNFVPNMALDSITGIQTDFDAVWVFEGWDRIMAEQMELDVNYFAFRDISPVFNYFTPIIITHEDNADSDLTERFLRATERGFTFARDNPREAAEILHYHTPETELSLLIASQEFLSAEYFPGGNWGYINATRWNAFFYWMRDNGFIPSDANNRALAGN